MANNGDEEKDNLPDFQFEDSSIDSSIENEPYIKIPDNKSGLALGVVMNFTCCSCIQACEYEVNGEVVYINCPRCHLGMTMILYPKSIKEK